MTTRTPIPKELLTARHGIIKKNPMLADMLGATLKKHHFFIPKKSLNAHNTAFVGWGRKASFYQAKKLASRFHLPIITLEDGFLHSVGHTDGFKRYGVSIIADDVGIYFDTTQSSRLEHLIINNCLNFTVSKQQTASKLIQKLLTHKLSKYNYSLVAPNLSTLAGNTKPHVLLIDQVANDASIMGAGAGANSFELMLNKAFECYPHANIWLKTHPAGTGYLTKLASQYPKASLITEPCNAIALLEQVTAVFTVSSHMGFEALMLGKSVHSFGVAWYTGFGLTDDTYAPSELLNTVKHRRNEYAKSLGTDNLQPTLEQLFFAAYMDYSFYGDPACLGTSNIACDIGQAIDYLITNRHWHIKLQGKVLAYDFSRWKKPFVRHFIGHGNSLSISTKKFNVGQIISNLAQKHLHLTLKPTSQRPPSILLAKFDSYVVWGIHSKNQLQSHLRKISSTWNNLKNPNKIFCMEDGFVRSQGLGATLIEPLSVVLDEQGIYYNAKSPSDLETILTSLSLDDDMHAKADALIQSLNQTGVTKYNVGQSQDLATLIPNNTTVHLVVGQVEDDASIKNCLSSITTNRELLLDVRQRHPNDFIIYKPHPDVETGLRVGQVHDARKIADWVAHDTAMTDCLAVCNVLHTISSLSGFEALIRGKNVVCYGLPFYAGFGLTHDIWHDTPERQIALSRRQRTLSLTELVYGVLIAYPMYRLPNGIGLAQAHQVIHHLAHQPKSPVTTRSRFNKRFMQFRQKRLK